MDRQSLLLEIELNIVTFSFTKVNNSSRIASGTRNLDLIPKLHHPKGTGATKSEGTLTFFDWEKKAWRSCRLSSIFGPWKVTEEHKRVKDISDKSLLF